MAKQGIVRRLYQFVACTVLLLALPLGVAHANEPVTITIGYYESSGGLGQTGQTMEALIREFMELNPHITVNTTVAPYGAFFQRLPVELAAGVGPDVWLSDGVLIDQYAAQGFALDLTDLIERDLDPAEYFGIEDNRDPEGRVWAFPQGLQSSAFFYNEEMFQAAGIDFPTPDFTYDDLRTVARRLTLDKDGDGVTDQYGFRAANHVTEGWFPVLKAFGGGALDENWRNSLFNTPESLAALQLLVDMIHIDGSSPAPGQHGSHFNWFPNGIVAMQFGLYVRTYAANQAPFEYNVTHMPTGPAGKSNPVIVNSWIINSRSSAEKQQAAWEWVKFFAGERAQTVWAELGEAVPINRQVAVNTFIASTEPPAGRMTFIEGLAYSTPLDPNAVWSDWVNAATQALDPAFRGQLSVAQAALDAHQRVQVLLDEFYGGE